MGIIEILPAGFNFIPHQNLVSGTPQTGAGFMRAPLGYDLKTLHTYFALELRKETTNSLHANRDPCGKAARRDQNEVLFLRDAPSA
ncbi:MAG: hypothetical protein G01um101433_175 [Parcubacteria group bacterium Gr01-1014_33]|nr:MAG: hypothetical protein G01um101433_175 [Parcubacteria group bacterium Gr01-1014_33]